jgi:GNAT superfamily N-acetyltransferase
MFTYIFPDASKRARRFAPFTKTALAYGHLYGEVYTTAPSVDGVAVWLPPGKTTFGGWGLVRSGMIWAPLIIGLSEFGRFANLSGHIEHLEKRDMPEPHRHLMILGVNPARQGQGVGSALIQPGLDKADAEGVACYLETLNERNLPFYEKHGFKVVVHDHIPKGGPEFWTMRRAPSA